MAAGSEQAAGLYKERAKVQQTNGREFIAEISPKPGDTVLDIGCGTGELTAYLAELVGPNGKVTGVDPDGTRIKLAQETYQHVQNLTFVEGSCDNYPDLRMASYDLIFSNYVFQWIFKKEKALGTAFQSLKPGGKVAVQTVSGNSFLFDKLLKELFPDESQAILSKWCFEGKDAMEDYLLRNGFEMLDTSEFISRGFFPSLMDFCKWLEGVTHGMIHTDSIPKERIELMAANLEPSDKKGDMVMVGHGVVRALAVKPVEGLYSGI